MHIFQVLLVEGAATVSSAIGNERDIPGSVLAHATWACKEKWAAYIEQAGLAWQ